MNLFHNNVILGIIFPGLFLFLQGVCIQGFGTFTFSQRRIELGGNKHILIQRPVLVMAERLLQTHSLQYPKQHATGT